MAPPRHGLARVLSKRGLCSRTEAAALIRAGRVSLDGRTIRDPEHPTDLQCAVVAIDGRRDDAAAPRYLMLNKPRGLVTTLRDEHGRDTVYRCLDDPTIGFVAPVGRLDKASEGLLLFTNDPAWAARITDPVIGPAKRYHVQVDRIPGVDELHKMRGGVPCDGELLGVAYVEVLRTGAKHAWLDIVLEEGRNRQIRRVLGALDIEVLRLVRIAIGPLELGDLAKGAWRDLSAAEVAALVG